MTDRMIESTTERMVDRIKKSDKNRYKEW